MVGIRCVDYDSLQILICRYVTGSSARSWADTVRGREAVSRADQQAHPPHSPPSPHQLGSLLRSAEDLTARHQQQGPNIQPDQEEEGWCTVRRARSRYGTVRYGYGTVLWFGMGFRLVDNKI